MEAKRVGTCRGILHHFMQLMYWGRCGCWDEGRNKHPYYGWKGDQDAR